MRSIIDARGSTAAAGAALLAGITLIAGSLLRVAYREPAVDVVSWTVAAPVKTQPAERTVAPKRVVRTEHVSTRVRPVALRVPAAGVPDSVGLSALDGLALPAPVLTSTSGSPPSQPEASNGLAAAATSVGDGLARGSQKAGMRTAGFFKRFGKKVAASFGR